jgi:hypothetical protein
MARGWESKAIESQQADREARTTSAPAPPSAAESEARARRQTLELARARAQADLARATHPAHRHMLELLLQSLTEQLQETHG